MTAAAADTFRAWSDFRDLSAKLAASSIAQKGSGIDRNADRRGKGDGGTRVAGSGRARGPLEGWFANLVRMLRVSQQIPVPVFYIWTSDILAALLAIFAAGNLVLIADAGLQPD
jgi:hypothetical protein